MFNVAGISGQVEPVRLRPGSDARYFYGLAVGSCYFLNVSVRYAPDYGAETPASRLHSPGVAFMRVPTDVAPASREVTTEDLALNRLSPAPERFVPPSEGRGWS